MIGYCSALPVLATALTMTPDLRGKPMNVDPAIVAAQSQAHAAWVQTIGSILALIVAIGVPLYLQRKERSAKAQDARVIARDQAVVLLRPLQRWAERCNPVSDAIQIGGDANEAFAISTVAEFAGPNSVPNELAQRVGHLHVVADAAESLQRLVYRYSIVQEDRAEMQRWILGDYAEPTEVTRWRRHHIATIQAFLSALEESVTKLQDILS